MPDRNDKVLREQLLSLLKGGGAHADFDTAVGGLPVAARGQRPDGIAHSPWEIVEHMRIAQWDILEFSRNPKHVSPEWPDGYWPKTPAPPTSSAWNESVESFRSDLEAICELVGRGSTDLYAPLPHGDGQTILREALLVADHNSYHLGELVLIRQALGVWKPKARK